MLTITNHQVNANQNQNEKPPHPSNNDYHQKDKITSAGKDADKREYCW
jgi:hypothetical protein